MYVRFAPSHPRRSSAAPPREADSERQDLNALLAALGISRAPVCPTALRSIRQPLCSFEVPEQEAPERVPPQRSVVGLIKHYVDTHAGEDLSLDRLAEEVGLSKYHLARLFRDVEGTTLWSYVQEARIRRARHLLEDTERPLSQIAFEVGFYDQSHFTTAFKRATGTTPGQYRADRKNLQD